MKPIFRGATEKAFAAEAGTHAEIISDGERAVLSLFDLAAKTWGMVIIKDASKLDSNAACAAFVMEAAVTPKDQGAVTEAGNEKVYSACLALEEELSAAAKGEDELDVDEEPDDADNDFL